MGPNLTLSHLNSKENIHPNIGSSNENNLKIQPSNIDTISPKSIIIPGFERKGLYSRTQNSGRKSSKSIPKSLITNESLSSIGRQNSTKKLKELVQRNKSQEVDDQYKAAEITIQEVSEQMSKAIETSEKIYKKAMIKNGYYFDNEKTQNCGVVVNDSSSFNHLIERDNFSQKNFCDSNFSVDDVEDVSKVRNGEKSGSVKKNEFKHLDFLGENINKNMTFSDNYSYRKDFCPTIEEETIEKSLNFSGGIGLTFIQNEGEVVRSNKIIDFNKNFEKKIENLKENEEEELTFEEKRKKTSQKKLMSSSLNSENMKKKDSRNEISFDKFSERQIQNNNNEVTSNFENEESIDNISLKINENMMKKSKEEFILKRRIDSKYISFKNSEKNEVKMSKERRTPERKIENFDDKEKKSKKKSNVKQFLSTIDNEITMVDSKINNIVSIIQKQEAFSSSKKQKKSNEKNTQSPSAKLNNDFLFPQDRLENVRKAIFNKENEYKSSTFILSKRKIKKKISKSKSPLKIKKRKKSIKNFSPENLRTNQRYISKSSKRTIPSKSQPPKQKKKPVNYERIEKIYKASFFIKDIKTNAYRLGEELRAEKELKKCTFYPKINKEKKIYKKVAKISFEERQKNWLEKRENWKLQNKKNIQKIEVKGCTFQPDFISRRSNSSGKPNVFEITTK